MQLSTPEYRLLRMLAEQVAEASVHPEQVKKAHLWQSCNDLKPVRPMVLLDPQNGWKELVPEDQLICNDPLFRHVELTLRRLVFRIQSIPDDFPVTRQLRVQVPIRRSTYGIEMLTTRPQESDGAYHIEPAIRTAEDVAKLQPLTIEIDRKTGEENLAAVHDLLGDLLDVQPWGMDTCRCGLSRILIHLRGLEQLYYDMYDEPELLHTLMGFLRDEQIKEYSLYQKEGLLSSNNRPDYITGSGGTAYNNTLPAAPAGLCDMVAWGEAQEFSSVGPEQFDTFILPYQLSVLRHFGLVDYGCCEPLDQKLDSIIREISRLRWVAVSPWANRELAAEKLGNKYVYVYKPSPTHICMERPDFESAEKQIRETIAIVKSGPMHIVMKDTSTFCHEPERATRWARMAVSLAENA